MSETSTRNNGQRIANNNNSDPNTATSGRTRPAPPLDTSDHHLNGLPDANSVRDVHRAGWLRYLPFAEKSSSRAEPQHRFWVVFSVLNDSQPYLEFYQSRQQPLSANWRSGRQNGGPVSTHSLSRCLHISPAIVVRPPIVHNPHPPANNGDSEPDTSFDEFAITLDGQTIRLVADSQQSMRDWIDTIANKLRLLGVLPSKDNLYTSDPRLIPLRRNSLRPLPPIPVTPVPLNASSNHPSITLMPAHSPLPAIHSPLPSTLPLPRSPLLPQTLTPESRNSLSLRRAVTPSELYETIFDANPLRNGFSLEPPLTGGHAPPLDEGPPPYESISGADLAAVRPLVSLRESQVLRLRKEIHHPSGVRLMARKKDCHNSIALVNVGGGGGGQTSSVWIAGWKQKERPFLHNTFHIGDQLLSINGTPVANAGHAYQLLKREDSLMIEFVVRRVPNGKVLCLKRTADGQDLGFARIKNTGEVAEVRSGGLADKAGLSAKCRYSSAAADGVLAGPVECNWCLTEINNRPLNFWFKGAEIETRLNSVGKEISILVQPIVFVKQMKKQLKQFRGYKDYIVQ